MKKTYLLDTNVLLQAPNALFSFEDNDVVLPEVVLEELDRFKKEPSELGANARHTARVLDDLRGQGRLTDGVALPGGGRLRIELNHTAVQLPDSWNASSADNRILKVCRGLQQPGDNAILVTRDTYERIKGDILGVPVQDFRTEQVAEPQGQYRGRDEVFTSEKKLNEFFRKGRIKPADLYKINADGNRQEAPLTLHEFLCIRSESSHKQSALGRFDGQVVVPLDFVDAQPFGVHEGQPVLLASHHERGRVRAQHAGL